MIFVYDHARPREGLARLMQLTIPKRHRAAFLKFIRLSPTALRGLVDALKRASPKASIQNLASELAVAKFGLDAETTHGIVSLLASLYRARANFEVPIAKFAAEFVAAAKAESRSLPESSKNDWSNLKKAILELLKLDLALGVTAKASELMMENERRLCVGNCRVLTDARAIFVQAPSKAPSAMMVQHVLKIAYHAEEDEAVREFYVAMSGEDMEYLQFILFRAVQKESSIRKSLIKTGVHVLGSEE
jgi:hypothetical protein